MLARRPMLCFAFAIMAGSVLTYLFPAFSHLAAWGWLPVGALLVWFAGTPRPAAEALAAAKEAKPANLVALPEEYARRIIPVPGVVARRGLDRFIVIASLIFLLVGVWRHDVWTRRLAAERLPRALWFDAVVQAQAPSREHEDEQGGWRVPALLLEADGRPAGNVPVRLSGPAGPAFRRGDVLRFRARREIVRPPIFPGAFDYRFWLERNGLAGSLSVTTEPAASASTASASIAAATTTTPTASNAQTDSTTPRSSTTPISSDAPRVSTTPSASTTPIIPTAPASPASPAASTAVRTGGAKTASYNVVPMDDVSFFLWTRRCIDAVRARAIAATLAWGGNEGGMLAAMLYGYRRDVNEDLRDAFRRVGIGHVLAISGLHVGLFVGLLWWLGGCLGWPARWRAILCLFMTLFYLGLTGGQVAASRAALMACIHLGSIARGRKSDMLNSLGAAAFFLTLLNPYSPLDVGFQLSFVAVVFISLALGREPDRTAVSPKRKPPFRRWRRWLGETASLARMSVATWLGLFPIIAITFNQANPAGLPINIVVIPLMSLVLAGGLLLPCLGWFPGVAQLLCLPARALTVLARWADGIPGASFPVNAPAPFWTAAFYCFLCLPLFRGMIPPGRFRRRAGLAVAAGACLSFVGMVLSMASVPPPAGGRIAVLPGGGETIVAEAPGGGIALIGSLPRNGRNAADWLRTLRRDGTAGVLSLGRREGDWSALAWQYPVAAVTRAASGDASGGAAGEWTPVPGAPGVEYAVSRDAGGGLVWFAARTGGKTVCVAPSPTARQLTWRLEQKIPGAEAEVMLIGALRNETHTPPFAPTGLVLYGGRRAGALPPGWLRRNTFGAVELIRNEILGYDGKEWRTLR